MKGLKVISAGGEAKDGSLVSTTSNLSQDEERYVVSASYYADIGYWRLSSKFLLLSRL